MEKKMNKTLTQHIRLASINVPVGDLKPLRQDITNGEDRFFRTRGFLDSNLGMNNQVVPDIYSLKDDNPTNDFLYAIKDYLSCDEHLDVINLDHLDDIDLEHEPKDNYPSNRYIEDSESSTDSKEYVEDSQEFVKETESMTDDSILERRLERTTRIPTNVVTGFHNFTLDDVMVVVWT
ncbi:hypothetical protein H5410_030552 [Solanum commersonii]|uniref:Uncharacterized protein n=1 Tax=Solanum commersonii TaxID=4109 RepID=A0A9J5YJN7_SOLCO|nr:hypothetical protein H5410_030552 [Solanum commersonii]